MLLFIFFFELSAAGPIADYGHTVPVSGMQQISKRSFISVEQTNMLKHQKAGNFGIIIV